tara:strand:- start:37 stop:618 length:582 start_codon:yes stop_codon:yes gene_type:complete
MTRPSAHSATIALVTLLFIAQAACSFLILPLLPGDYGFSRWYSALIGVILLSITCALLIAPLVFRNSMAVIGSACLIIAIILSYAAIRQLSVQILLLAVLGMGGASLATSLLQRSFKNQFFFAASVFVTSVLIGIGAFAIIFRLIIASWSHIPENIGFELFFYSMVCSWVFLTVIFLYSVLFWYFEVRTGHSA